MAGLIMSLGATLMAGVITFLLVYWIYDEVTAWWDTR